MKRKVFSVLQLLAFVPPALFPTGLYLAGDKNVFSIQSVDGNYTAYRVPDDDKGGTITLNEKTSTPIYVYINKDKDNFEKKMNPPVEEDIAMNNKMYSLTDQKLFCLIHYLLTTQMHRRQFKVTDTALILNLIDQALLLRTGGESKFEINQGKWESIKEVYEEAICSQNFKLEKSKSSLVTRQVQSTSDSE